MSQSVAMPAEHTPSSRGRFAADTLADSVILLLLLTVMQRVVGLLRGVLLVRWLDPAQLGQWDMVMAFFEIAAPLAVLGIPGSFGRYVEQYRGRGSLRSFLSRTTIVCSLLLIVAVTIIVLGANDFSKLIFGSAAQSHLVLLVAICLGAVIAHNYLAELFAALRLYRLATMMQFMHSLGFAVVAISLVLLWEAQAAAVVAGYGAASFMVALLAAVCLRSIWKDLPPDHPRNEADSLWRKLLPFAAWVWLANWLTNMFFIADRYMIVHFSGVGPEEALALVGQYHSSRVLPLLFVSITTMLGTMIVPHLTHDWEAGQRDQVSTRLRMILKVLCCGILLGSIGLQIIAPLLFWYAFGGKYADGLAVLPGTLVYCAFFGIMTVAQAYLWCAERARYGSVALGLGLIMNVVLNYALLPYLGLQGAVIATICANALALTMIYLFSMRLGLQLDAGTWLLSASPLILLLGPLPASACVVVILLGACVSERLLNVEEKRLLMESAEQYWAKARTLLRRFFPQAE